MSWRESLVRKNLEKRGFRVELSNYMDRPGIPDFECMNFETGQRYYLEVKNEDGKLDGRQLKVAKGLMRDGFEVRLARVGTRAISYFRLDDNLGETFLEEVPIEVEIQIGHRSGRPMKCPHCGYEWMSRVPNPKRCPNPYCQKPLPSPKTEKADQSKEGED